MAFSLTSDMDIYKDMPAYKPLLKTILKSQIQLLVNQLAEYGDEECLLLTASLADFASSHIGSKYGHSFLTRYKDVKSNFMTHCLESTKTNDGHFQQSSSKLSGPTSQRKVNKKRNISQHPKSKHLKPQSYCTQASNNDFPAASKIVNNEVNDTPRTSGENFKPNTCEQRGKSSENAVLQDQSNIQVDEDIVNQEINGYKVCLNISNDNDHTESHPDLENVVKIDDVIIKVEPDSMEQCEDGTLNTEDKYDMEDSLDMEAEKYNIELIANVTGSKESTLNITEICDLEISSDSNLTSMVTSSSSQKRNSGLDEAYLRPEFLCCNDSLIWAKNNKPKQKRTVKTVSLWKKYSALKEVEEKKKSKTTIAKEYGVPRNTLSTWLKYAEQIKADVEGRKIDPNKTKRRFSKFYDIESALLEWLKIVHMQAVIPKITSVNICDKANQLAKQFGYTTETFQCTKGWVERFKARHGFDKNFVKGDDCFVDLLES